MKRILIGIVIGVVITTAGTAVANISHVLGNGGVVYKFDEQCHRPSFLPPGLSVKEGLNVVAQNTKCLVRRPDPWARCVRHLGLPPVPAKGHTHPDGTSDWSNVDKMAAYELAIYNCSFARFNNH